MNLHFQTFRLQPPHAPPSSGNASCSGRAWPAFCPCRLSPVLRTSFIPSSLISRITPNRVCVAASIAAVLRTIRSLPVALHPVLPRRSYFQFPDGKLRRGGTLTLGARSLSSALGRVRPCAPPLRPKQKIGRQSRKAFFRFPATLWHTTTTQQRARAKWLSEDFFRKVLHSY
jgi:hypothetical protein